ncbi:MAG: DUF6524 family protein [Marinovum algicola]|jgi:hypothetical protein|uniref:Uncharacterized protein n=1 Tax=Marinovum algicola TaxID=42444 RepID=A0A975ZQ82_9RHOB|nr:MULTISPECIES: DUF6524 family protein [Marinovum]MDD9740382.1 DUF6524 family protein [Marinovum sp. SP66]MDD9745668.1 DUF6524 family protein [Marinovum sp. PR37]SEK02760.1 hypothetical protein SAMN04487940_11953 [Marinovum algicola]SLN74053.1 hypothetical protein MAA5396_04242 [Marinovum algicola]
MGFLVRWVFAFLLVAATFNPTAFSYLGWALRAWDSQLPLVLLLGLLLLVGWIVYLRATLRSIGAFGMMLIAAIVAALLWVLHDFGVLTLDNQALNTWLGILALSTVLGIGLSWSILRRRLSGQADVDDVDV